MRNLDLTRFAFSAIRAHRLRSFLTVLGILVGISAVVLLTSIGEGIRQFVLAEFTQFGTNIVAIVPGKANTYGASGATISTTRPLTLADAEAIARLENIEAVVPMLQGNANVEFKGRQRRTMIFGVSHDMPVVWKMNVRIGRFLPAEEFTKARAFAVLGSKMRSELFATDNPLGQRVRVGGESYRIVGVMESKGQMLGFDLDDTLFIPVIKAMDMFDRESVMEIDIIYNQMTSGDNVIRALKHLLITRHSHEDFTVIDQDQMLKVLDSVLGVITLGIGALGGISLLVGAVGILTIMTIAVTERTAEIGLLRALGGRRRDILGVFLMEAVVLGAVGGAAGILTALLLTQMLQVAVPNLPVSTTWMYVGSAFSLAVIIGLLAGLAPALRAGNMQPLDALRTE